MLIHHEFRGKMLPKTNEMTGVMEMSKYFIDKNIYFQNKKMPPRKIIIQSMIQDFQDNYVICYDEDGNDYRIMKDEIFDDNDNPIKDARERLGMSQIEFAKFLDTPRRTLEDWESGKSNPPRYVLQMIMEKVFTIIDMKEGE